MECKREKNLKNCNCSFDCEKKGICCDCIAYHRARKELPACYFTKEMEATGDRGIKNYFCGSV